MATGLEISFDEEDYSIGEGDISDISMTFGETQAPFRMELIPVTVDVAKTLYNLTDVLTLDDIIDDQEALSGDIFIVIMCIFLGSILCAVLLTKYQCLTQVKCHLVLMYVTPSLSPTGHKYCWS